MKILLIPAFLLVGVSALVFAAGGVVTSPNGVRRIAMSITPGQRS